MNTAIISFSPTGGTLKCANALAQNIGNVNQLIDLTDSNLKEISLNENLDTVIIAVPSYGGRMPSLAVERLKTINGKGMKTILMAVYGNRDYEDSLAELEDIAKAQNFIPVAAISAIAQHCMDPQIATNRPDVDDIATLCEFAKKIADKLITGNHSVPTIPGNRPYKKAGAGMCPKTDNSCVKCGVCIRRCPIGAISVDDPSKIDASKCIGCMRCVAICPTKSKHLSVLNHTLVHVFLSLAASKRKEPELFY